jgi:hypothetical protein
VAGSAPPPNIDATGRRHRMAVAVVGCVLYAAGIAWVAASNPPAGLRALLALPAFLAALGFFQAQSGT